MVPAELWMLALFVVCLVMSAFFSSSETAFIALPRRVCYTWWTSAIPELN